MAIGERIHFLRILRGRTKKYLGTPVGFPNGAQMCVWHSTKLAPVNQKQT